MRSSSPPIAIYATPLKGMDAREVRPQDAPNLLYNIDLSNRAYYQERPRVRPVFDLNDIPGITRPFVLGMHTTRVDGNLYIIVVYSDDTDKNVNISIFNSFGEQIDANGFPSALRGEPLNKRYRYSFVNAGRFVYFCNGYGLFWQLEVKGSYNINKQSIELEAGARPEVYSYIEDDLSPSSLTYFFQQLVISGFRKSKQVSLTKVSDPPKKDKPWPPKETLSAQRDKFNVDTGCIFVAEPGLWRSYPIEDPGGFYWIYNEDVTATAGIGTNLIVFGRDSVRVIIGHGGASPRVTWLADVSLVGPQAMAYYDNFLFFVALDGCYITNGQTVQKVSHEMDPLWFGTDVPQITRYTQLRIKDTVYPYHVNRLGLSVAFCINDTDRKQVMIGLPANGSAVCNMVWVYNYSDITERVSSQGKWSIWGGELEPKYGGAGTSLTPGVAFPNADAPSPTIQNSPSYLYHWTCGAVDNNEGKQRLFFGTSRGMVLEFGSSPHDYSTLPTYTRAGVQTSSGTIVRSPIVIGLGLVGRVDSDGRIICTDVAVRRKQLSTNYADGRLPTSDPAKLIAIVRSEGEGLRYFDVDETDVEFSDTIVNSQEGVSANSNSFLKTLTLGASPTGSNAPLMQSEYIEAYARVNTPDDEGRAAYVDLYCLPTDEPARIKISEIRVHGSIKGGSQREQS